MNTLTMYYNGTSTPNAKSVNNCDQSEIFNISTSKGQEEFLSCVFAYPHGYNQYAKNYRLKKNFLAAHALVFDFDNKGTHTDSTIEEFQNSEFASKVNYILYTSKSHQLEGNGDCYHVVLPLDTPIGNRDEFDMMHKIVSIIIDYELSKDDNANAYLNYNPSSFERSEEDFDRFQIEFCLGKSGIDKLVKTRQKRGERKQFKKLDILYMLHKPKKHTAKKVSSEGERSEVIEGLPEQYSNMSRYDNTILDFHPHTRNAIIDDLMSDLNQYNRDNHYNRIDEKTWSLLGCWIAQMVDDYDRGLELFEILSDGHPLDTPEIVKAKYDNCVSSKLTVSIMIFAKPLFFDAGIIINKKVGLFSKQDNSRKTQANKRNDEIHNTLVRELEDEYGKPVTKITPYRVSESVSPVTQGYIFEFKDNTTIRRTYKKGELKLKYKNGDGLMNKLIISKNVHDIDNNKSKDSLTRAYNKLLSLIVEKINDWGYLTSKNVTGIIKLVVSEYGFTQAYTKENMSKQQVLDYLVKQNIIIDKQTQRERHDGGQYYVYKLVNESQYALSASPVGAEQEEASAEIIDDDWDWENDTDDYNGKLMPWDSEIDNRKILKYQKFGATFVPIHEEGECTAQ